MKRAGFTLVELLVVLGLIAVITAIAVLAMPRSIRTSKADSAMTTVIAELRRAREMAVSERRDMEVRFVNNNEIRILRLEVPSGSATLVRSTLLEGGFRFVVFSDVPDTPDGFGKTAAVSFGSSTTYIFRTEATFTDNNANLDPISGTIFIGLTGQSSTARAATIFGPSALVRGYRWDGRSWIE